MTFNLKFLKAAFTGIIASFHLYKNLIGFCKLKQKFRGTQPDSRDL